jgi:signal peptidase II
MTEPNSLDPINSAAESQGTQNPAAAAQPTHGLAAGRGPRNQIFWTLLVTVLALDVISKRWAERALELHVPVDVLGNTLRWTLTYNTGAAMSLSVGDYSRPFFSGIAILMVGYLLSLLRSTPTSARAVPAALALVAAGALGNLIDRLRHARGVVDFIDVGTAGWRFWTFNVADIGVSCGAVLLALLLWREDRATSSVPASPQPSPGSEQ